MTASTLERALEGLAPVLDRLVVVGGTAHALFPRHPLGDAPPHELLRTEDVDLAVPLELAGDPTDRELLERLEELGFEEQVSGCSVPAYSYPDRRDPARAAYLQFIAPRTGSGQNRDGSRDRLLAFGGLRAEKLSRVNLLLHEPWSVEPLDGRDELSLRVVNPVAFLVQKLLILSTRGRERAKDVLYLYDTLAIFGNGLGALASRAPSLVPHLSKSARAELCRAARKYCFAPGDASVGAALIAASQRANPPDSERIARACELGLRRVLADVVPQL